MSFNVWCDKPRRPKWRQRRELVAALLRYHLPDALGGQEFLFQMAHDLKDRLPEYAWVGVGREDGLEAGEMTPIFYRKDRLELLEHSTFWLSPNEACARGWDAMCRRTVTWGRFRDRQTGAAFFLFNTHFDHLGIRARRESAWLLVRKISALGGGAPSVVTGDFNSRESSSAYAILTGEHRSQPGSPLGLKDAFYLAQYAPLGPRATWQGLLYGAIGRARLDYIFVKNDVTVVQHAVFPTQSNGAVASDHSPVVVEISLEAQSEPRPEQGEPPKRALAPPQGRAGEGPGSAANEFTQMSEAPCASQIFPNPNRTG